MKIAKMEEVLANARLIDESQLDVSKVLVLSKVKIKNLTNNMEMVYTLVAESVENKGEIAFRISRKIENDFVVKDIRFEDKGQQFHYFEKVKLHTTEEMQNYGRENGLELLEVWGNYDLGSFDEALSPRCINLFRKK